MDAADRSRLGAMRPALASLLCAVGLAHAQDAFLDAWRVDRSRNPAGLEFKLSAPKTTYFAGEVIAVTLELRSSEPNSIRWTYSPESRLGVGSVISSFVADPASRVEDPKAPARVGGVLSGPAGVAVLSEKWIRSDRVLNEWVRFKEPGTYRVYGRTDALHLVGNPGAQRFAASEILTIEIVPAPRDWAAEQIAAARKILAEPVPVNQDPPKRYEEAVRTLAFLDTPEAEDELLRQLGDGRYVMNRRGYNWLLFSRDRVRLIAKMEALLVAPDHAVWGDFLGTLRQLHTLTQSGPVPDYASEVAESLDRKTPQARSVSVATLLTDAANAKPAPVWMPLVIGAAVDGFRGLPAFAQANFLSSSNWDSLKGPAMLPVLRDLYAKPPEQRFDPAIEDLALRRMFELAPDEARRLLLAEIQQPSATRHLRWSTFAMLPDAGLPDLNEMFAAKYEGYSLDDRLILRYATGDIVERVKAVYVRRNAGRDRCGSNLVPYFLKYDPAFGEQELRRSVAACSSIGFRPAEFGPYVMSPALEKLAAEFLMNSAVRPKTESAELLGKFGSAASREALWSAMEYFQQWWKGRDTELVKTLDSLFLERALRTAIGKPSGKTASSSDLSRLLSLCTTGECKGEVMQWMQP